MLLPLLPTSTNGKMTDQEIYEKLLAEAKAKDLERATKRFPNYETIYLIPMPKKKTND